MRRFRGRGSGRGGQRPGFFNRNRANTKRQTIKNLSSGPTDKTIPELEDYYFDCNSFNEADRYINTKEKIIQYLGTKYGGDVRVTLEKMQIYKIPVPDDPVVVGNYSDDVVKDKEGNETITKKARDKISYSEKKIFDKQIGDYVARKEKLARNLEIAYSVVFGQCSETLQHKLKNSKKWDNISTTQNVIDLLELIKVISYRYEEDKYLPLSIHNAKSAFYKFNQRDLSLNDYREKFSNVVERATSYENSLYDDKLLDYLCKKKHDKRWTEFTETVGLRTLNSKAIESLHEQAHEVTVATGFIASADKKRYGKILDDLENDCIKGKTNYPTDMAAAYKLLNEYHTGQKGANNQVYQSTQLAFAQKTMKCFKCGLLGYTVRNCPNCTKDNGGFKQKDQKHTKPPKSDRPKFQKKSFAQVKEKPKAKKSQNP